MKSENQNQYPSIDENNQNLASSELERLLNELTCAESSPERLAEEEAAARWRRHMFEAHPYLTVPEVHRLSRRRLAAGYFRRPSPEVHAGHQEGQGASV